MNSRELSEKLDELATKLEEWFNDDEIPEGVVREVMRELRKLSTQNYTPGNGTTWEALKTKVTKPPGGHVSKTGKKLPF